MNKKEAIKRLEAIEDETKELRKIINSDEYTLDDLRSYENACNILKESYDSKADTNKKIKTIVKAANYIDNSSSVWKPDFTNNSQYKYLPYFTNNGSGFELSYLNVWSYSTSYCPVGLYYKVKSTGEIITKRFISLYKQWLEE